MYPSAGLRVMVKLAWALKFAVVEFAIPVERDPDPFQKMHCKDFSSLSLSQFTRQVDQSIGIYADDNANFSTDWIGQSHRRRTTLLCHVASDNGISIAAVPLAMWPKPAINSRW